MSADLHIHSTASDGKLTPGEIVREAIRVGLTAIALTDHDTVAGLGAALQESITTGLEVIPGIELNTDLDEREIHILGYFLDLNSVGLLQTLDSLREAREWRARMIIAKLEQSGIRIEYEQVAGVAGGATIGRPHIAQVLCEAGHASSVGDAFERYLGNGRPAYIAHHKLDPFMAIETVLEAGGLPVLAHPGLAGGDEWIPEFVRRGLVGIEVYYPFHTPGDTARYRNICLDGGLVMTGGTDFHGPGYKYPPLGTVTVPDRIVEELKAMRCRHNLG